MEFHRDGPARLADRRGGYVFYSWEEAAMTGAANYYEYREREYHALMAGAPGTTPEDAYRRCSLDGAPAACALAVSLVNGRGATIEPAAGSDPNSLGNIPGMGQLVWVPDETPEDYADGNTTYGFIPRGHYIISGGALGIITSQNPAGPVVNSSDLGTPPPNLAACELKLAKIFGGPGAVVSTGYDPPTLGDKFYAGKRRAEGHSAAPYNPFPGYKGDRGGIIHIYTNAAAADITVGLYMPPGGVYVGGGAYPEGEWGWSNEFRFKWTSGPLKGLQIKFNHVGGTRGGPENGARLGRFQGDVNRADSVRIGHIGGIGGDGRGYKHSHLEFEMGGNRVDPRAIFCKEFGY